MFCKEGDKVPMYSTSGKNMHSILQQASDWEMQVDPQKRRGNCNAIQGRQDPVILECEDHPDG